MRQKIKWTAFIVLLVFLSIQPKAAAVDDAIVAIVNDDVITFQDLNDYMHGIYIQLKAEGKTDSQIQTILDEMQNKSINRLIEDKLILQEADLKGVEIRPKVVDDKLEEVKKQYVSDQEFQDSLLKNGLTITDLRKRISDQLKIRYFVEDQVKSKIFVNPQEVTDYYNKNSGNFQSRESVDLDSIFVSKTTHADAKLKAEKALAEIKSGKDFTEAAKEYSDSPPLGVIQKGEMLTAIDEAVFDLKEGAVSKLIDVDTGYYIFKVKQKFSAKESALEEVREKIRDKLFNDKYRETYNTWVVKLKKKAFIEIKQ